MTAQELEIAISKHEMQRLELKESFGAECVETACAFANASKLVAQVFYDMHLIEHYGSGTRRIKDECLKNGNRFPRWSQQYGSFITVYDSRLKKDEPKTADTIIGTIKAADDTINLQREPLNEPLKMFVLQKVRESPGISRPALIALTKKSRATITRALSFLQSKALIEHRGSDKTGGYYAMK